MLNILKTENNEEMTLALQGRLDSATANELEKYIGENFHGQKSLVYDLKDLDYISSAGLRILLVCQKIAKRYEVGMKLVNVKEEILEVLNMTGFTDILTIE